MAATKTAKMTTGLVRFSFCNVLKPRQNDNGEDEYTCMLIIPKTDKKTVNQIRKMVDELKKDYWGNKVPPKYKGPLRDGDEYVNDETGEQDPARLGHYYMNVKSKFKPDVVDKHKEKIDDERDFYSGCYGLACVNFYVYDNKQNKGISAGLSSIMKIKDGEPLGGASSAEQDFKDVDISQYDDEEDYDYDDEY